VLRHDLIAELRQPKGPPSGAPYWYRKEKETHELIFSWLSWLAVLLVGATHGNDRVMQHGGHTPNNRLTGSCSLGLPCTSLILDIHAMINWHLSKQGICWPVSGEHIAGSSLQLIEVTCFLKLTADQVPVFEWIVGSCQDNLLKTRQDCSEAG